MSEDLSPNFASELLPADTKCLHCKILQIIVKHFEEKCDAIGGNVRIDMPEVCLHIGKVLSEFFAAEPDKERRDGMLKQLFAAIHEAIAILRARGDGAFPKKWNPH